MGVLNITDQVRDIKTQRVSKIKQFVVRSLRLYAEPDMLASVSSLTMEYAISPVVFASKLAFLSCIWL